MSEITNEYSSVEKLFTSISNIIGKACYTGCLSYVYEISDKLNKVEDITKIHEKINELIESFNKNTDNKFKELFETRDNYCDNNECYNYCNYHPFLSCVNFNKYMNLKTDLTEIDKFCELARNINNEIISLYIQNKDI